MKYKLDQTAHRMEPWTPSEEDHSAYTGRYFSRELQTFYTIAEKDSGLVLQHRRIGDIQLTPTKEDTFSGESTIAVFELTLVFMRDKIGRVTGFSVSNGRTRGVRFEKWEK